MRDAVREKESLLKQLYEHPSANDSYGYRKPTCVIAFWIISEEETRAYTYLETGVSKNKRYVGIDCSGINHFPHYTNKITSKIRKKYEYIVSVWLD